MIRAIENTIKQLTLHRLGLGKISHAVDPFLAELMRDLLSTEIEFYTGMLEYFRGRESEMERRLRELYRQCQIGIENIRRSESYDSQVKRTTIEALTAQLALLDLLIDVVLKERGCASGV